MKMANQPAQARSPRRERLARDARSNGVPRDLVGTSMKHRHACRHLACAGPFSTLQRRRGDKPVLHWRLIANHQSR